MLTRMLEPTEVADQFQESTLAERQLLTVLADAWATVQEDGGAQAWEAEVGRRLGSCYTRPLDLLITIALELRTAVEDIGAAVHASEI